MTEYRMNNYVKSLQWVFYIRFQSPTSVKSFFSWRADEQSTKGTKVVKVAMNWNVI